ncbi:unnamed protein product, partial [Laminaria digitata]
IFRAAAVCCILSIQSHKESCHDRVAAGVLVIMHGRGRMTVDPRIPTIPGRGTSVFRRPGRQWVPRSGGRRLWAQKNQTGEAPQLNIFCNQGSTTKIREHYP